MSVCIYVHDSFRLCNCFKVYSNLCLICKVVNSIYFLNRLYFIYIVHRCCQPLWIHCKSQSRQVVLVHNFHLYVYLCVDFVIILPIVVIIIICFNGRPLCLFVCMCLRVHGEQQWCDMQIAYICTFKFQKCLILLQALRIRKIRFLEFLKD